MLAAILWLAGIAALALGAFLVSPALGFAVLGLGCLVTSFRMAAAE